ncbi:MAG TPA: PAS domain S-box protein [Syntrophorhabdaceae bacterium]|nr:PAS domain S-box protein [Syntrophorhabdaceae bacterium]
MDRGLRKREVENELERCQKRFQELFENMHVGILIYETYDSGKTFIIKDVNSGAERIEKKKRDVLIGRNVEDALPEVKASGLLNVFKRVYKTGNPEHYQIGVYKEGSLIGWSDNYVYRLSTGEVVTVYKDETERKQIEEKLLKSEERYRNIFESIIEGIFQTTPNGRFILVNPALAHMYGYDTPEEMITAVEDIQRLYVNPEDRVRFKRLIETHGFVKGFESSQYHKNGSQIWISINAHAVKDKEGNIICYEGTAENITLRKKAEKELLEQQEELRSLSKRLVDIEEAERKRFSQKLHDTVGQNLTAISINLNIINAKIHDIVSDDIKTRLKDSLVLLEQTTEKIRNIMSDLRPSVLDDYGLLAAIKWYGRIFSSRTGINVTVEGAESHERLNPSIENALFRITQEALTNTAKHSGATDVYINLNIDDDGVYLNIYDNGGGFDASLRKGNKSFEGLDPSKEKGEEKARWGLINMRERAISIKGELKVESEKGKGTKVIVKVPKVSNQ